MKIRERCRLRDRGDGFLPSPAVVHGGWPRYTLGWTPREKCVKSSYPLPSIYPTESMEAIPMTKTMVIEPVRACNGLDVLVARDEGLFASVTDNAIIYKGF